MAIIENEDFVVNVNNADDFAIMLNSISKEIYRMSLNSIKKEDIVIKNKYRMICYFSKI